ncbi:MAG: hypothetical protein HYY18_10875 [Planctomycetes bacterium]|nr:hypothetical protein [Planctomycetota bacterium]
MAILDGLGVRSELSEAAVKFLDRRDLTLEGMPRALRSAEVFAYLGKEIEEPGVPRVITFGDNIVLVWELPKVTDSALLGFSQPILHALVRGMEVGLLLRGAVSFGEYILDGSSTIIGPALVDAHFWSERANWIGVVATPKLGMLVQAYAEKWRRENPRSYHYFASYYVKYQVPLTDAAPQELWCYPWPFRVSGVMNERNLNLDAGREHVLRWLSQANITPPVQGKYDNALAFFDWYSKLVENEPPEANS